MSESQPPKDQIRNTVDDLQDRGEEIGEDIRQAASGMRSSLRIIWIVNAVLGVLLGIVLLFNPFGSLLGLAIFGGIALLLAGIARVVFAIAAKGSSSGIRWAWALLGVLTVIAGILALTSPLGFIIAVVVVIALGWMISGIADVIAGVTGSTQYNRTISVVGGVISVIAGVTLWSWPASGALSLVQISGILLIVFSIASLAALPNKQAAEGSSV